MPKIPCRDALQGEPGQQRCEALRPAQIGWQERRVKAKAGATAVPYPGHLDAHRTNAGVYLALRQGAIPDHRVAALGISSVRIPCEKHGDFYLNRLGQESLGALT